MSNLGIVRELEHLDEGKLCQLIKDYYNKNFTVQEILDNYSIHVTPTKLVSLLPPQIDEQTICKHCGAAMLRKWESRSNVQIPTLQKDAFCIECGHKEIKSYGRSCSCTFCTKERQQNTIRQELLAKERIEYQKQQIVECYGYERNYDSDHTDIFDIDLRNAIYLLSMERQSVSKSVGLFSPILESDIGLSPSFEISYKILNVLKKENQISVDPNSPFESFCFKNDELKHYIYKVHYYSRIGSNSEEAKNNILKLENAFKQKEWPDHWKNNYHETLKSIWLDISLYDCLNYLSKLGEERGFNTPSGDKTITTMLSCLQDFSVSTLYSFIHSAMRSASDYYMSYDISKRQAANSVVGRIQTFADKVRIGEWNTFKYNRYKGYKNSALYDVLFYLVLQIGDKGFTLPAEEALREIDWIEVDYDE